MKFNDSIKKLSISTFALVMLFGFGLTASANAQGGYEQDRYGRYGDDRVRWTKDRTRQYAQDSMPLCMVIIRPIR
jgi:hypothetical protein